MKTPSVSPAPKGPSWRGDLLLGLVAAAVLAFYAWTVAPSQTDWGNIERRGAYYNRLVDGFAAGQLNLKVDVPPALAALPDPYDPAANSAIRMQQHLHDTSYYGGKIYLYYGVTPALVLFGPYHALTGGYLFNREAALIFCALTFLASALLVRAAWRRYFPNVSAGAAAAALWVAGLASGAPLLLRTPAICELVLACGAAFAMGAMLALWAALHQPAHRARWLVVASVCYGLAVGARPSLLFGALVLLLPVWLAGREAEAARRRPVIVRHLAAALVPIACIGIGLAWYNYARFGSIFEFGQRYQLAGDRQDAAQHFSLGYLGYNLRSYLLSFAPWHARFPFVGPVALPPPPAGHAPPEGAYGMLVNTPVLLCAAALPLLWRERLPAVRAALLALAWWLFTSALLIGCFYGTVLRYQYEFAPAFAVLAALGLLALERFAQSARRARPWRLAWIAALAFSTAFVALANVRMLADEYAGQAVLLAQAGRHRAAIARCEDALRIDEGFTLARRNLAQLQLVVGDAAGAAENYERVVRDDPDSFEANNKLGFALFSLGRTAEARPHFETAVRLAPRDVVARINLAATLERLGRASEAVEHFEVALQLAPETPGLREALEATRAQAAARP